MKTRIQQLILCLPHLSENVCLYLCTRCGHVVFQSQGQLYFATEAPDLRRFRWRWRGDGLRELRMWVTNYFWIPARGKFWLRLLESEKVGTAWVRLRAQLRPRQFHRLTRPTVGGGDDLQAACDTSENSTQNKVMPSIFRFLCAKVVGWCTLTSEFSSSVSSQ